LEQQVKTAEALQRLLDNQDFKLVICDLFIMKGTEAIARTATSIKNADPAEYQNQLDQLHARHHLDIWMQSQLNAAKQAARQLAPEEEANG
jgi:hypothetical protein